MSGGQRALVVLVDGAPMPEPQARALWQRFSDWMEEHRGDLAGFAAKEGFASVHPGVDGGRPVLRASRTAPQEEYGPARDLGAAAAGGGGSPARHGQRRGRPPPHDSPRKKGS
jgi:hypothetical protein